MLQEFGFGTGLKKAARIKEDNYRKAVILLTLIGEVILF